MPVGKKQRRPVGGWAWGSEWRVPSPKPLLFCPSPSSPFVWLLLSCSVACWPPQDEFSWLCQSCCHLFAVLEPAKWLSFKPRAAGRASAKPRHFPCSPPLLQRSSFGSCHLLSAGQPLLFPHHAPPDSSRPPQASASHGEAAQPGSGWAIHCRPHHPAWPPTPAQTRSALSSPHFLWGPLPSCSQEPPTERLKLGSGSERARRCPVLPAEPMTEHVARDNCKF